MVIQNLVLEVTRRCNMACEHCLRGDAQNMDMSKEIIDEVLKSCNGINSVTFTGGESSLNISIIRYFFEQAEKLEKLPFSFYLVTNGKTNQLELAIELIKWYPKMEEQDFCGVALSKDLYHDESDQDPEYVRALSFYSNLKEIPLSEWNPEKYIIAEGRASEWGERTKTLNNSFYCVNGEIEMLYVSANGKLIGDCDFSYDHIDELSKYDIWHLRDLEKNLVNEY